MIDQAAAALDWQSAFDLVGRGLVDLDGFEAAVAEQVEFERLIKSRFPALKAELGAFGAVTSSVKTTATARVTSIEAALAGRGSLTEAAHGVFGEVVDTITHEMGHRYQMQLIGRLDPNHSDPLSPGDPEYEQARWVQQDDNYFNDHDEEFAKIYFTSPSETHSRGMGNEVKQGLQEGFDLPADWKTKKWKQK